MMLTADLTLREGYKIVSIGAAGPDIDPNSLSGGHSLSRGHPLSLQSTALWYPSVPSPDLHLNDESLTGAHPCTAAYEPLIWTQFGGPKGASLHNLTEVRLNSFNELAGIEFDYKQTTPIDTMKLGRHDMTVPCDTQTLSIDGPGGEYIQRVYANTERWRKSPSDICIMNETLHSLKVGHIYLAA